jgi:hypothetical protein
VVAFWVGDDGVEALLFDGEIAAAVPGGPLRRGVHRSGSIEEAARKLVALDEDATRERIAEQERERIAEQERATDAEQQRERIAEQARECIAEQERDRVAEQERPEEARQRELARDLGVQVPRVDAEIGGGQAKPRPSTWTTHPAARVARPPHRATRRRVVRRGQWRPIPEPVPADGEPALVALAKLLRCGPWRGGKRSSDLLSADGLPPGAETALRELAGAVDPTPRALGNALKHFHGTRIEGLPAKLLRMFDGHGFAIWQVVTAHDEASEATAKPSMAELLCGALVGMGYCPTEAADAVLTLGEAVETKPIADLVREALRVLSRRPTSDFHTNRND